MRTSRRGLLLGSLGAALVGAFDPVRREWISTAHADAGRGFRVPPLDGELVFDSAALAEGGQDFGGIVEHTPWAVLRPASIQDIAAMVAFARRHRLSVAMRGQAHSTFGQAQAESGVVIDSRTLAEIHELDAGSALVDAGVTWRELVTQASASGLTPQVLTDYLDLSVGGVLSVGGIGGSTHRFGFVADTCLELTVVTGQGDIVCCSATRHPELFNAVLGGLGQCAIIVQARVALAPAAPLARVYQLTYTDLAAFLDDQRLVCGDERFDFLQGLIAPLPTGGFAYVMQGAVWYEPSAEPSDDAALSGLSPDVSEVQDVPYVAWLSRVDAFVAQWKAAGVWTTPHPWCDLFLPDDAVESFVSQALSELGPDDVGPGVILLYPFRKDRLHHPLIRVPETQTLWLFDILRFTTPASPPVDTLLAKNRSLFERAVAVGGKRYPISAIPLYPQDFPVHYGNLWWPFFIAKQRWDPHHLLAPGQGIFAR